MLIDPNAYRHHPDLAARIVDPSESFFRDLNLAELDQRMIDNGRGADWRYPDAVREAMRADALSGREGHPLWVFGYGSLMWDPGFRFDEVRHGTARGYSRSMCLVDRFGARGSPEAPGLMAGLAEGGSCEGLVFRIPPEMVQVESEIVWRREMIAHAYRAVFVPVDTAQGRVEALAFVADETAPYIDVNVPHETQVGYIATGQGMRGTSLEYLEKMLQQFHALEVEDPMLEGLLRDVQARLDAMAQTAP